MLEMLDLDLLLWIGLGALLLCGITWVLWIILRGSGEKGVQALKGAVVICGAVFIGVMHYERYRWRAQARDHAEQVARQEHRLVAFRNGNPIVRIEDAGEVARFQALLVEGVEVHAHHSGPIGRMAFGFDPRGPGPYELGRDSDAADEFWWSLTAPISFSDGSSLKPGLLRQFHSPALSEWLRKNVTSLPAAASPR